MATKPVNDAFVEVTAGNKTGAGVTQVAGRAAISIRMQRSEYEALQRIAIRTYKNGYEDGQGNITALPPWNDARANGISSKVVMEKIVETKFLIEPTLLKFDSEHGGGTATVNVTCPDSTWEVYSIDSRLTAVKQSVSSITVTCPGGLPSNDTYNPLIVRWFDALNNAWQYRECAIEMVAGAVTFINFTVYARNSVSIPAVGAAVDVYITGPSTDLTFSKKVGSGITAVNGSMGFSAPFSESEWNDLVNQSARLWAFGTQAGYDTGYMQGPALPTWAEAQANGVVMNDAYAIPITSPAGGAPTRAVSFQGSIKDQYNNNVGTSLVMVSAISHEIIFNGSTGTNGTYITPTKQMNGADYQRLRVEGIQADTGASKVGGGALEPKSTFINGNSWPAFSSISGAISLPNITVNAI